MLVALSARTVVGSSQCLFLGHRSILRSKRSLRCLRALASLQTERSLNSVASMADGRSPPVWIDCDAGSDDALGLLLAAKSQIVGVSSVRGNTATDKVSHNVLRVLDLCSRQDVPVYTGANHSLNGQQQAIPKWSGQDGLGDQPDVFPASASIHGRPASGPAANKLCEAAAQHAGKLVMIATGPLTNLAHALQHEPRLVSNVHRLVVMGGNEARNDWTATGAEFNFFCDPDAAAAVIHQFSGKTTLLTWESMQRNPLPGAVPQKIAEKGTRKAEFITAICGLKSSQETKESWVPCDPLAFAVALDTSIVTATDDVCCTVDVDNADTRGQTQFHTPDAASKQGKQHDSSGLVHKVDKVDVGRFAELLDASTD